MDYNAPPPDDDELPDLVEALVAQAAAADLATRQAAYEGLYELAFKVRQRLAGSVPVLLDGLFDPDAKIGESALWALHYCSPDSIGPLMDCLDHPQAFVRERAAQSLGQIGDEALAAAPALLARLEDDDAAVRRRAAWAIGLIHDTAPGTLQALARAVAQGGAEDKAAALHALGNLAQVLPDPAALAEHQPLILSCLDHAHGDVVWSALFVTESLGLPPQDEVDRLEQLLQRGLPDRVLDLLLSRLRDLAPTADLARLLPLLTPLLAQPGRHAGLACEVLSRMQPAPREALAPLRRALEMDDLVLPAAQALWKIERQADALLPALARVFQDHPESSCDLICEMGPAAAPLLPQLIQALSDEDWDLQWAAADALGAVASAEPAVVASLLQALGHPSPIVRSAAARALARTGQAVVSPLKALLQSPSDLRSAWAAYALGQMGPAAAEALPELRAGLQRSPLPVLVQACAIALAHISADTAALPHLLTVLRSEDPDAPRRAAATALAQLGPAARSAVPVLESLIGEEDDELHQAAEEALRVIQGAAH